MTTTARTIAVMICRESEGILDEYGTIIRVANEGAGEFITLEPAISTNIIGVSKKEWPVLQDAIEKLLGECRG